MIYGFLIEGIATLLCRLSSKLLSEHEPAYANYIDSFIATSLVVAGKGPVKFCDTVFRANAKQAFYCDRGGRG